jgi:hypothetical protein
MSALVWGIKASLLGYVRGMPDGAVTLSGGAEEVDGGFRFPAADAAGHTGADAPLAFRGAVTLTGHGGMLRVTIADPALVDTGDGWVLEIADPDDPGIRLRFATLAGFDGERATGAALTEDGADLFFGPYERGTAVDDPRVVA